MKNKPAQQNVADGTLSIRRNAIVNSACEQIRALLDSHFDDISRAACDSFSGDDAKSEPIAKLSLSVEFGAIAQTTTVSARIGWSMKFSDESEENINPLQEKLDIE